jgi:predicted Zn-dependent protease
MLCMARGVVLAALLGALTGCFEFVNDPTGGLLRKPAEDLARTYLLPAAIDQAGIVAFRVQQKRLQISRDPRDVALVERVKGRIVDAARQAEFSAVQRYEWEIVLAKDDQRVDAVAFPGGKIVVWTGLLRKDARLGVPVEERVAVVLGHEIVHALARHAAQRIDAEMQEALLLAKSGKDLSDGGLNPAATAALMTAIGVEYEGAVMRPFSATQESEADHAGLLITARAGYDPQNAVVFWEQIKQLNGGKQPPEFLTMHPSYDTRISQLNGWMAEAQQYYQAAAAGRAPSGSDHAG